jgi:hypothetical protein
MIPFCCVFFYPKKKGNDRRRRKREKRYELGICFCMFKPKSGSSPSLVVKTGEEGKKEKHLHFTF